MIRILDDIILGTLLIALGFGSCECSSPLRAQSRPSSRALADVARCLVAEDERGSDWGAILDVLERRGAAHGAVRDAVKIHVVTLLRRVAPCAADSR